VDGTSSGEEVAEEDCIMRSFRYH